MAGTTRAVLAFPLAWRPGARWGTPVPYGPAAEALKFSSVLSGPGAQMACEEGEHCRTDPGPRQVIVTGVG